LVIRKGQYDIEAVRNAYGQNGVLVLAANENIPKDLVRELRDKRGNLIVSGLGHLGELAAGGNRHRRV
jgi:hypothetical protein